MKKNCLHIIKYAFKKTLPDGKKVKTSTEQLKIGLGPTYRKTYDRDR